MPGAAVAALLFQLGKTLFVFYIDNLANLEAVYGSVSSIIVLLIWFYFCGRVILYGAEVISVARRSPDVLDASEKFSAKPDAAGND